MSPVHVVCFTRAGAQTALRICEALGHAQCWAPQRFAAQVGLRPFDGIADWTQARLADGARALVFVGACGIAVRAIAPHVRSKMSDPAVVSVDEAGAWCVPLLSGHVGGANELARRIARALGGQAAVSTATDVRGAFAVDEWAARRGLAIANPEAIRAVASALLEGRMVGMATGAGVEPEGALPEGIVRVGVAAGALAQAAGSELAALVYVGPEDEPTARASLAGIPELPPSTPMLRLVAPTCVVGVGCRRGCEPDALRKAVHDALSRAGLDERGVACVASIDLKADEPAVLALAQGLSCELRTFAACELAAQEGAFSHSDFVAAHVGVDNVCERAVVACGAGLLVPKTAGNATTVALGLRALTLDFDMRGTIDV